MQQLIVYYTQGIALCKVTVIWAAFVTLVEEYNMVSGVNNNTGIVDFSEEITDPELLRCPTPCITLVSVLNKLLLPIIS